MDNINAIDFIISIVASMIATWLVRLTSCVLIIIKKAIGYQINIGGFFIRSIAIIIDLSVLFFILYILIPTLGDTPITAKQAILILLAAWGVKLSIQSITDIFIYINENKKQT